MNIDINDKPIKLSLKIARVCDPYTAVLYSALLDAANDNHVAVVSLTELSKITNISRRSLPIKISKLLELGIIEIEKDNGNTTKYHIKDIFEQQLPAKEKQPEQKAYAVPKPKQKRYPYYVMLANIGSCFADDCSIQCEEDLGDADRDVEECTIPEEWAFSDYPTLVEDALKFLAYYSLIEKSEYKKFVEEVILCLTEAICTGKKGNTHGVDPVAIIRRINEIIHDDDGSFDLWLSNFARKYVMYIGREVCSKNVYEKHAYLKTSAINYLTEHKAAIVPEFLEEEGD